VQQSGHWHKPMTGSQKINVLTPFGDSREAGIPDSLVNESRHS
jgi:hypothetical protein